jgi:hypothetical protein
VFKTVVCIQRTVEVLLPLVKAIVSPPLSIIPFHAKPFPLFVRDWSNVSYGADLTFETQSLADMMIHGYGHVELLMSSRISTGSPGPRNGRRLK